MRNAATGTSPPLCNVHLVVFADMGRAPPAQPKAAAMDVLEDLLNGERVSRARVEDALKEMFSGWVMGGTMAQGYYPDIPHEAPRGGFRPPPGFRPPRGWPFGGPPPEDPQVAELREARRRARLIMGFAETEPITRDSLRARHRELVKKFHPDRGGDPAKMAVINDANDVLEASLS